MKIVTTRVNCRGCNAGQIIKCAEPSRWNPTAVPFTCIKCGSDLIALIKRDLFKNNIHIKVNMVRHTKTLLNILKRRAKNA